MRDREGQARWVIASIGALVALMLVFTVARGKGGQESSQWPIPTPTLVTTGEGDLLARPLTAAPPFDQQWEGLYAEANAIRPEEEPAQQRMLHNYRQLRLLATRERVPSPSGCVVARRAWQVQAFLLAKEAWDDCYLEGETSTRDYGFYAGILRNLGRSWSEASPEERVRYKGLTYLVACVELVDRYALTVGECRQDLERLVGRSGWPPAAATPLLLPLPAGS